MSGALGVVDFQAIESTSYANKSESDNILCYYRYNSYPIDVALPAGDTRENYHGGN